jgi:hypothetical protein
VALSLAACVPEADDAELGAAILAITHGVRSSEPALVAFAGPNGLWCSGMVVADRVVLTAAHCLTGSYRLELLGGGAQISGGHAPAGEPFTATALELLPHPEFDATTFAHDIGLVVLDRAVPASIPRAQLLDGSLDESAVGSTLRVAGFGATLDDGGAGGALETTSRIDALEATRIRVVPSPGQPCRGDSGGPALAGDGSLVGVISVGDAACTDHSYLARVDSYRASFIEPRLAALAPGSADSGERCHYAEQCAMGDCVLPEDAALSRYCAAPCRDVTDCRVGMECLPSAKSERACRWPLPSPRAQGATCADDGACESNLCGMLESAAAGRAASCLSPCVAGVIDCANGASCEPVLDRGGLSACASSAPPPARDTGCSLAAAPSSRAHLLLVALACLLVRRSRRHFTCA